MHHMRLYLSGKSATMQLMKLHILFPFIAALGISFCTDIPAAAKSKDGKAASKEPVEWFVVEVSDMFGGRVVTVASSNELTAINEEVTRNNRPGESGDFNEEWNG
jgi:hypothetical protein